MQQKIIKKGKGHRFLGKHEWKELSPQELMRRYGLSHFENLDGWYGKWRDLYECECGAELLVTEVAFI